MSEHFKLSFSSPVKLSKWSLRQCLRSPECYDSARTAQKVTTVRAQPRMIRHCRRSVSIWPEALIGRFSYTLAPGMSVLLRKGVSEFPLNLHLSPLNRSVRFDD